MNIQIGSARRVVAPQVAIILYGQSGTNLTFATEHSVIHSDGQYELAEGKPLTGKALNAIGRGVKAPRLAARVIHQDVLYLDGDSVVFWTKASKKLCHFKCNDDPNQSPSLEKTSLRLALPSLVWVVRRKTGAGPSVHVYAVKAKGRPTDSTELFSAPLMNVESCGEVCWGNTMLPKTEKRDEPDAWVEAFFSSAFTHFSDSNSPIQGAETNRQYAQFISANPERFPLKVLKSTNMTLGNVLSTI